LHVDDDPSMLELSKQILVDMGDFEFDNACCVDEAFKKLATGYYDVIISDYEMPQRDGLDFLRELRKQKNEIPFVLFTGKGREEVAIKALNLGADGYHNKQGSTETVYGELAHNISAIVAHKRTKNALRQSEERFSRTFKSSPVAMSISRLADGLLVDVNESYLQLFELNCQEVFEHPLSESNIFIHPNTAELCDILQERGAVHNLEVICQTKKGKPIITLISLDKMDFNGQVLVLSSIVDLTERRRAEKELHEAEEEYRSQLEREERAKSEEVHRILDGVGDLLFVLDKDMVIVKVNKATCNALKKKPEEMLGKHCYEIVHGTNNPWPDCPATKTLRTKQIITDEVNDPNLGMPLLVTTSPIFDEKGEVIQVIHAAKDITTIKLAESEMYVAANLFDVASDAILVYDLDGRIVYFNEAAYKLRGYSKDEFQKLNMSDLDGPCNTLDFGLRMKKLLENGEGFFETYNLRKDNSVLPIEIHSRVIESLGRKLVLSVVRDISGRKVAEEKLMESQERCQATFESAPNALMLLDEKHFFDCNTSALRLFGFDSVEEFAKNHPADLSPKLQPDGSSSIESANSHIQKALWMGKDNFFWVHKRTDGTTFPAEEILTRIQLKNRDILVASVLDISDRKEAEDKIKEDNLKIEVINEKLRVVGRLSRHDVRNKLSAVTGYSYLIKKKHGDLKDVVEAINKIEEAVKDSMKIFDFARKYEQIGIEELVYIDTAGVFDDVVWMFSDLRLKVVNELKGLSVLADSFLTELFYNLVDNTLKYGKKTTVIRVHFEKTNSGELNIVYEDDGEGISAENKLKLFSEGLSTGGTGYGLFLIKRMMNVYGWQIKEIGEPSKGAKFVISIPAIGAREKENFQISH
jgi:PAS domain S-box-containing protein